MKIATAEDCRQRRIARDRAEQMGGRTGAMARPAAAWQFATDGCGAIGNCFVAEAGA